MKLCSPSNGCETRPVKGDPPTPGASLAASAVTKTPMRRHASEWAVGLTATKYGSPKVRVGHIARLSRGGCSSMLVQQSMIMPMSAAAEWKPKARRVIMALLHEDPAGVGRFGLHFS